MSNRTYATGLIIILLSAFGAGFCTAKATAEEPPRDRPVTAPMIASLDPVAVAYWNARGVYPPVPVEVFRYDAPDPVEARAQIGGNVVWLTDGLFKKIAAPYRENRPVNRYHLCVVYIHERGHNGGLDHTAGWPVMQEGMPLQHLIHPCVKWSGWR